MVARMDYCLKKETPDTSYIVYYIYFIVQENHLHYFYKTQLHTSIEMFYYGPAGAGTFYIISLVFVSAFLRSYTLPLVHASVRRSYLCILFKINNES